MKIKQKSIKSSNWARRTKRSCPTCYKECIELAQLLRDKVYEGVTFYHNDDAGIWQWSILPYDVFLPTKWNGFWLDSFPTKRQAVECCREMKWKILK